MLIEREKANGTQVLSGWKDIANYLGKGVRTVQRYERELGLPIRRPNGKWLGSVIASSEELDAWVNGCPARHSPALRRKIPDVEALKTFQTIVAQQRQLREELEATRKLLRASVTMIRESMRIVHADTQTYKVIPFPIDSGGYRKLN